MVTLSAASLVDAAAPNVTDPFYDIMITVVQLRLKHLQVPNLQTRRSEGHLRWRRRRSISTVRLTATLCAAAAAALPLCGRRCGCCIDLLISRNMKINNDSRSILISDLKVHGDGRPRPLLLVVGQEQLNLCTNLRLLHPRHALNPATHTEIK